MDIITAKQFQNNVSAMLEKVQHDPVMIQKQSENIAVLLSFKEYDRLINSDRRTFQILCDDIGKKACDAGLSEDSLKAILD